MSHKTINSKNYDYYRTAEKPYPKVINWKVIAPKDYKLSIIQDHDVVFDNYDMKIRQLPY